MPGTRITSAHIIPKSVGGRLEVPFLCFDCNSRMGSEIEAPLLADPGIRHCVEILAGKLPTDLVNDMRERQRYFAESDFGHINAAMTREGELRPLESATFKQEGHARAEMEAEWTRQGLSADEIAAHLTAFESAPPDQLLHLPGFTVRPRIDLEALDFNLPWSEDLAPETLPLGIAFLYVCLFLGQPCYEARELDPIREALKANDTSPSEHWSIEHLRHADGCAPVHHLGIKEVAPIVVHVQLFQERVWRVTFPKVGVRQAPPAHYGIDIADDGEGEFTWTTG